jgi:hypothetical protein
MQVLLHDQAGLAYPTAVLTGFINEARQQVALEGECVRAVAELPTIAGTNYYNLSSLNLVLPATPLGIDEPLAVRAIQYNPGFVTSDGSNPNITLEKRNWEWFSFYVIGFAAPPPGPPRTWCPYNQGAPMLPQGGTTPGPMNNPNVIINPPNAVYTLLIDGHWSVKNLAADADPEAIPGPWTLAVPHYALYLAFKDARLQELAKQAMEEFEVMMVRARAGVTPLREQLAFPGGLSARRLPGEAPPQRGAGAGPAPAAPAQGG